MILKAPINKLGYGYVGLNILKLFPESTLFPIPGDDRIEADPADHNLINQALAHRLQINPKDTCLTIWHQHDLFTRIGSGVAYGWPIFELDRLTPLELASVSCQDRLIVCSRWAANVLAQYGISADVVPLGCDQEIFQPVEAPIEPYVFLNVGKWEKRKGHDFLIRAFGKAFQPKDKVELWLLPHNPFLTQIEQNEWTRLVASSPLADKIKILPRQATHQDVAAIMGRANCGVFPARAEGWNLELCEMLTMRKPCIATNYAAHTEYCTDANCMLISCPNKVDAHDGKWFFGQGQWADLGADQMDQLVGMMRLSHKNSINSNVETNLSWKITKQQLEKCLV